MSIRVLFRMKRSANNVLLAVGILLAPGWVGAAGQGRSDTIRLPPLAVVTREDETGKTWHQNGEIRASLEVARKDFEKCLSRQGWHLEKTIPLAKGKHRSSLCTWNRRRSKLLVMLRQVGPGRCTFAWGIE